MNYGIVIGSILSGFAVTWGWLFKISYKIGKLEQKLIDLNNNIRFGGETW